MLNKISLPILLTVMAVLMFVVVMLYGVNTGQIDLGIKKNGNKSAVVIKEEPKIVRTDYAEVARKTLDWIDKQRNESGWYILARRCDYEKKTCDTVWDNKEGNKDGLIATWARLNFYEQHKDPKDLEIVIKDIDIFYDKYKDDNLKDSLWICKITYEMAQSKYLDQTQKKKLEEICFGLEIPEVVLDKVGYIKRREGVAASQKKDTPSWNTWIGYGLLGTRGVDGYFGLTSDLINQYRWKKDELKLEMAKKYFESAKEVVGQLETEIHAEDECLLGLGAIDLWEYGGRDVSVLNYAIEKHSSFFEIVRNVKKHRTTICGLFSKRLYQVTKKVVIFNEIETNNKVLISGVWDNEFSLAKTVDDDGFYMASISGGGFPFKNVAENGLVVELIRN